MEELQTQVFRARQAHDRAKEARKRVEATRRNLEALTLRQEMLGKALLPRKEGSGG